MENFENNEPTKEELREQAITNILGAKRALNNLLELDIEVDEELKKNVEELDNKIEEILKK